MAWEAFERGGRPLRPLDETQPTFYQTNHQHGDSDGDGVIKSLSTLLLSFWCNDRKPTTLVENGHHYQDRQLSAVPCSTMVPNSHNEQ